MSESRRFVAPNVIRSKPDIDPTRLMDVRGRVISLDLDDLLFPTFLFSLPAYNRIYRTHITERDYYRMKAKQWGAKDRPEAVERLQGLMHLPGFLDLPPMPGATEATSIWKKNGNKLVVNTSRPEALSGDVAQEQIAKWFPNTFSAIRHTVEGGITKGEIAIEEGADIHLDDHPANVDSTNRAGVLAVGVFDYDWSKPPRGQRNLPVVQGHPVHACNIPGLMRGEVIGYRIPAPGTISAAR